MRRVGAGDLFVQRWLGPKKNVTRRTRVVETRVTRIGNEETGCKGEKTDRVVGFESTRWRCTGEGTLKLERTRRERRGCCVVRGAVIKMSDGGLYSTEKEAALDLPI